MKLPIKRALKSSVKIGPSYSPEATALFARFTTQPNAARKTAVDNLYKALKAAGLLAKMDVLYILAAHDSQAARRNWIADQYNLSAINSPTFVADRGYNSDGSSSYLNSNMQFADAAKWTTTAGHIAGLQATSGGGAIIGGTGGHMRTPSATGGDYQWMANNFARVITSNIGFHALTRSGTTQQPYSNNDSIAPQGEAIIGTIGTGKLTLLRLGDAGGFYNTGRVSFGSCGALLNSTEMNTLRNAVNAYMIEIGAPT